MIKKILLGSALCVSLLSAKAFALDNELFIYETLLSQNNSTHAKVAAQSIHNKGIQNLALSDMVAQVLLDSMGNGKKQAIDTQAWLLKALGASKSKRYQKLIVSIIESGADSKVRKYAKQALANLSQPSESSFRDGDIDLKNIAAAVAKKKSNLKPKATKALFNQVYTGDTIEKVIESLGLPPRVDVNFATKRQWGITASYSMLSFKYKDLGSIVFYFESGLANWTVRKIDNSAPFSGELSKHPIMSSNASVLRAYVRGAIKQTNATALDFDLAAERLYSGLEDDDFVDALSWTCKFLATSGSSTYRQVLVHTMETAGSSKLRKYAKKSLSQLPVGDAKQYQKGDVFKAEYN